MGRFGEPDQVDRLANLIWAVGQVLPKSRRSDYETCVVVFAAYLMGLCMPLAHWLLSDADLLGDSWEVGVVVAVFPVVMVLAQASSVEEAFYRVRGQRGPALAASLALMLISATVFVLAALRG